MNGFFLCGSKGLIGTQKIQKNTMKGDFELLYDQKRKHYICKNDFEAKIKPKIRARRTAHLMVKAAAAGSSVRVRRRADGGGQTSVHILHMAGTGRRRRRRRWSGSGGKGMYRMQWVWRS